MNADEERAANDARRGGGGHGDAEPRVLVVHALAAAEFAPFGEVLEVSGEPSAWINGGHCARYSDLAALDVVDGAAGISLFAGSPYAMPHRLDLVERHPLGSQAFLPLSAEPFLVVVAEDDGGTPVRPRAFVTDGRQGVNYRRGTWHGVLTPLAGAGAGRPALFGVIDRIGAGTNLEEHRFERPWLVVDANREIERARAALQGG